MPPANRKRVVTRKGRAIAAARARGRLQRCVWLGSALVAAVFARVLSSGAPRDAATEQSARVEPLGMAAPPEQNAEPTDVAWTVSGFIRDEQGGAVASARVCAVCAVCDAMLAGTTCTSSDLSGAYSLELSDARAVTVSASARGFRVGHANAGRPVHRHGASRTDVDIALPGAGARLAGVVMDALGGPIDDARVQLWRLEGDVRSLIETRSDKEGRFELWSTPGSVSVRAEMTGYAAASRSLVAPSEGISLQLIPASTLSGTVVERTSGKPVAGAEVHALFEGMRGHSYAAVSGADGQFTVTGLEPGRYVITAEHARFRAQSGISAQLGLAQVEKALIVPMLPAVSLLGKIVSADGEPCVGGSVTLQPIGAQTSGSSSMPTSGHVELDGSLQLRGLTPGRYEADVWCRDHVLAQGPSQLEIHDSDMYTTWRVEPGPP